MGGTVLAAAVEVVAERSHHLVHQGQLGVLVEVALYYLVGDGAGAGVYLPYHGLKAVGQFFEYRLKRGFGGSGFVKVQKRVVGRGLVPEYFRLAQVQVQYFLQVGGESREIGSGARPRPGVDGGGSGAGKFTDELGRKLYGPVIIAPGGAQAGGLERILAQTLGPVVGFGDEPAGFVRGELYVGDLFEGRDGGGPGFGSAGGHIDLLVPAEDRGGRIYGGHLGKFLFELKEFVFHASPLKK